MRQIILECTGQFTRFLIGLTERELVFQIADPNRSVRFQPVFLIGS